VNICLEKGVQTDKVDVYGRSALHYASINGHADVCRRLLEAKLPPNILDMDNYSPLVYATLRGSVDCVRVLLEDTVFNQLIAPVGDLIPLSLASQSGHVEVVLLLLHHGAKSLPNSNGEYPIHLAAKQGHADVCRHLLRHEGWDTPDKYHEWTPVFHAARHGHESCIEVFLQARCRVDAIDELGNTAVHYAAWYSHHSCVKRLLEAAADFPATDIVEPSPLSDIKQSVESEIDLIPSLSLPPPIMPHHVYGHNYLDKSYLVQVSIGQCSSRVGESGVRLHPRLINPAYQDVYDLASTPLKLVMTTSPDVNSAPYSILLPQRDKVDVFTFQIPSPNSLSLEFSIYPNFGTKTIGRAIALPSLFTDIENKGPFILPILDNRLHVVGEVYHSNPRPLSQMAHISS
jgi:CDK inhibitor PHO81